MKNKYYDGTKLLSLKDINGNTPEFIICCGNRTAGKTVYFNRLMANKWLKRHEQFALVYRFKYSAPSLADAFWGDIGTLFFPEHKFEGKVQEGGTYVELYLDDELCGYGLCLNSRSRIKELSHLFNSVEYMLLDEFQSEDNKYCSDEIRKFRSVHESVARGKGHQVRFVQTFLVGNCISLINPYFVAFGLSERIQKNTKFLKSNGLVLEQTLNESAREAQQNSAFNSAFIDNRYLDYSSQNVYLDDNMTFIEKMSGENRYLLTIVYKGEEYCIRSYEDRGVMYCGKNVDKTFSYRISITTDDMRPNYVMLKNNEQVISYLKYFFNQGCFRFKNLQCKEAIIHMLAY